MSLTDLSTLLNPSIIPFSELVSGSLVEVIADRSLNESQKELAIAQLYVAAGAPVKSTVEIDTTHLSEEAIMVQKAAVETDIQLTWPEIRLLHLFASEQARLPREITT